MTCLGYARVSTEDQSLDIQREQLKAAGCKRIFEEKASGKSADTRDELQAMMRFAEDGDIIIVCKLDRLARSTLDMLNIVTALGKRGVKFRSLAEPWANTDSPAAELILTLMAGVAQFERGRIKERQLDGIAQAKKAGKYKGRKRKVTREMIAAAVQRGITKPSHIAKELNCGRATVYRLMD